MISSLTAVSSKISLLASDCQCTTRELITTLDPTEPSTVQTSILLSTIPDIHLAIFDHLDPVTSTCLGLTCKHFYRLHIAKWGLKISLLSRSDRTTPSPTYESPERSFEAFVNSFLGPPIADITRYVNKARDSIYLCACIKDWIGTEFAFCVQSHKYVKKERCMEKVPDGELWIFSENLDGWPTRIHKFLWNKKAR